MTDTTATSSWRDLISEGGLGVVIFVGGVTLQALEVFIGSAMLPTVVREIGGIELYAWNTTLFIVASIAASIFTGVRPAWIGPRGAYLMAAAGFAAGSLICGLALSMPMLLLGRLVQGFGAGMLTAMTLAMLRLVFAERLWPRAMALNAVVWGVSTMLGPAVGGIFAELGIWRWAFLGIVPLAALLAAGAWNLLPAMAPRVSMRAPLLQIALVVAAILAISVASLITANTALAVVLLVAATGFIAALAWVEARTDNRLLPLGALSLKSPMGLLFASALLLGVAISSDIFGPFFFQRFFDTSPMWAGYLGALVAAGWSIAAIITSSLNDRQVKAALFAAPLILLAATLTHLVTFGFADGFDWGLLTGAAIAMFTLGFGIGLVFQHITTRLLSSSPAAENDRTSAAISTVQLFASGLGAAIAGVVVNAAGLPDATTALDSQPAARWLFIVFAVLCIAAWPLTMRVSRGWIEPTRPS